MKVGSLFSGIGGLDLGLEQAGMEIVWQCEKDINCQTVLNYHWPDIKLYDNVKNLLTEKPEDVDLLAGGFPCQDLSVSRYGSHMGLSGPDSNLVYTMATIAKGLKPEWLVIENVPQVRNYLEPIKEIFDLWRLEDVTFRGYQAGAATRRRRTFIIGHTGGRSTEAVSFIRESCEKVIKRGGPEDVLPMCLPWKGGPSLERLGSCVVENTETNPTRIREGDGVSRWLADTNLYLMLGNSVPPPMAKLVGKAITNEL